MSSQESTNEQIHPLYSSDRQIVDRLLAQDEPDRSDLVDLARLFIRYEGFQGSFDIQADLLKSLKAWKLTREDLNIKTRELWSDGIRPGDKLDEPVGSGFDTSNNDDA